MPLAYTKTNHLKSREPKPQLMKTASRGFAKTSLQA